MKYSKHLSIFLGTLFILTLCLMDNMEGFNTPPIKAKTETGKDTLLTVKN